MTDFQVEGSQGNERDIRILKDRVVYVSPFRSRLAMWLPMHCARTLKMLRAQSLLIACSPGDGTFCML
jgi:hypothetical protein